MLRLKGRHPTDDVEVLDDLLHSALRKGVAVVDRPDRSTKDTRAVRRDLNVGGHACSSYRLRGDLGRVARALGVVQFSLG